MVTKVAKASTVQGKRLQAETIATTDLAIGSEAIGFTNDSVSGVFVNVAILCCRQSEKKASQGSTKIRLWDGNQNGKKRSGTYSRSAAQLAGTRAETQGAAKSLG